MRIEEFTKTGSNHTPKVGDKVTIHYFSDAEPAQVVEVSKSGKTMWIRKNVVTVDPNSDGGMGHQEWIIHENEFEKSCYNSDKPELVKEPDNYTYFKVTKRKDGTWRTSNSKLYVALGQWHKYYDWSF